jgi:hypothetical protein
MRSYGEDEMTVIEQMLKKYDVATDQAATHAMRRGVAPVFAFLHFLFP